MKKGQKLQSKDEGGIVLVSHHNDFSANLDLCDIFHGFESFKNCTLSALLV